MKAELETQVIKMPQKRGRAVAESPDTLVATQDRLPASRRPKVDWWITEFCNYTCDFCWVPTINISSPQAKENEGWKRLMEARRPTRKKIAEAIAASDAEDVTLCGGEPLLVNPLEINEYGRMWRENGKNVTINTNASFLKYYFDTLEAAGEVPEVDRIKISIDGADDEGVKNIRGERASFKVIEEGAKLVKAAPRKEGEKSIELVLTTMVGRENMYELERIAEVVKLLWPASWRLLEYSGRENDADRHRIERRDLEFWTHDWAPGHAKPIPVFFSDNNLNAGCFIIDQLGNRQIPSGDGYIRGPNCLEVPINEIWANDPATDIVILNKQWLDQSGVIPIPASWDEYLNSRTIVDNHTLAYVVSCRERLENARRKGDKNAIEIFR